MNQHGLPNDRLDYKEMSMRTINVEKTLYKFEELSESAKQRVIERFGNEDFDDSSTEYIYEDATRMGALMGIEIDTRPVKLMGGGSRQEPTIYFSGFSSQGDGACFEGRYRYAKGGVKAVKAECNDEELIRIATALQEVQRRNFYRLRAVCVHRGHYQHSGCMSVDVEDCENQYRDIGDAEDEVTQCLRDFADWIYNQLENEYEYRTSEDAVAETCEANEYEFDEKGNLQ